MTDSDDNNGQSENKSCPKCNMLCTPWTLTNGKLERWVCDACGYGKDSGEWIE